MSSSSRAFAACGLLLCACSHELDVHAGNTDSTPKTPPKAQPTDEGQQPAGTNDASRYAGPPLRAAFEKQGQQQSLRVTVTVPGAGYELRRDGIQHDGDIAVLLLTLDEPDPDQPAPPARQKPDPITQVASLADLTAAAAGVAKVRVEVAEVVRGRAYFVAPAHLLAAEVAVPR
jgi:hypothetical protein